MSKTLNLSKEDLGVLGQSFVEEAAASEIWEASERGVSGNSVSLSDLYKYATGGGENLDAMKIEEALASYPGMRNAFRSIVSETVFYRSGEAVAAGEVGPIPRSGKGFSIRYQTSQSSLNHIYIIIELRGKIPPLRHSLYIFDETDTHKIFSFSPPRDGIIQILVPNDDPLLEMLADPKTEVMLG